MKVKKKIKQTRREYKFWEVKIITIQISYYYYYYYYYKPSYISL